jgi:hypothetical protein
MCIAGGAKKLKKKTMVKMNCSMDLNETHMSSSELNKSFCTKTWLCSTQLMYEYDSNLLGCSFYHSF